MDIPNVITAGGIVAVFAFWAAKELFYDKKKALNGKVDATICNERHSNIEKKIDRVQDSLDEIYEHLISKGN